jgi:hypothetical protein
MLVLGFSQALAGFGKSFYHKNTKNRGPGQEKTAPDQGAIMIRNPGASGLLALCCKEWVIQHLHKKMGASALCRAVL